MGQCQYFLKIQEDKVKDEKRERKLLLQNFKRLGLKNKRLEDELKGKAGNLNKRIKLTKDSQKELEKIRKEMEEQWKQIDFWKRQTQ